MLFIARCWRMRFFGITGSGFRDWSQSLGLGANVLAPVSLSFLHCEMGNIPPVSLETGRSRYGVSTGPDTEEALKEFDFLVTAEDGEGAGEARSSGDGTEWGKVIKKYGGGKTSRP